MQKIVAASLLVLLTGCVTTTEPVPVGPDSYMISTATGGGAMVRGQGPIASAKAANQFCDSRGLHMIIRRTDNATDINGTTNALIFSCVAANDPEYRRPNLRRDPNVVVQDNR